MDSLRGRRITRDLGHHDLCLDDDQNGRFAVVPGKLGWVADLAGRDERISVESELATVNAGKAREIERGLKAPLDPKNGSWS
jgi:hypothetical protein